LTNITLLVNVKERLREDEINGLFRMQRVSKNINIILVKSYNYVKDRKSEADSVITLRLILGFIVLASLEFTAFKARDTRRITAAEIKYVRRTAGYTWTDYKTNAQITKELKITPILDKLTE
jgi:hypothetical protein